jgi:hypothetical protein
MLVAGTLSGAGGGIIGSDIPQEARMNNSDVAKKIFIIKRDIKSRTRVIL